MNTYMVWLRLTADTSDELLDRIHGWDVGDDEGVVSVTHEPDTVQVPDDLQPPPPPPTPTPAPPVRRLDSVEPSSGPAEGGTQLTLHGSGFTNIGGVRFEGGGETGWAWSYVVVDDTTITCPTPPMAEGTYDVIAFDGDPGDAVLKDGFTYTS